MQSAGEGIRTPEPVWDWMPQRHLVISLLKLAHHS